MRRGPLLALLVLTLAASAVSANMICIKIEAELTLVDDPFNLLQGAIQPGLMMYGLYTYESTTEDNNTLPTVGDYWHHRDPYGIKVAVGPFIFETDPADVQFLVEIVNDHGTPPRDNYLLRSYHNLPLPDGIKVDHISWQLDDPEATALESEKLPDTPPYLPDWQSIFGLMVQGSDPDEEWKQFYLRGHVSNASLEVCEPYPVCISLAAQVAFVDDPGNMLEGTIAAGDLIQATYRYDASTQDNNNLDTVGDYWHYDAPYGISASAGGWLFQTDPANTQFIVEVCNDHGSPPSDNYLLRSYNNLPLANGTPVDHISWQLDDESLTALSTEGLPLDPPDLSDWTSFFGLTLTGSTPPYGDPWYFVRAHVVEISLCELSALEDIPPRIERPPQVSVETRPNPFHSRVEISYTVPAAGQVRIDVFDLAGRNVRSLLDGWQEAGSHQVVWNGLNDHGRRVESGVYFYRITAAGYRGSDRVILLDD